VEEAEQALHRRQHAVLIGDAASGSPVRRLVKVPTLEGPQGLRGASREVGLLRFIKEPQQDFQRGELRDDGSPREVL
jgi:hypothetical protein